MDKSRILCIVGPTACHKTDVSIHLAHALDAEIVSADSVQVYRDMDIGSAKPTKAEREGIPHHMVDCVPVDEAQYSVACFREQACAAIDDILTRGKLPIVVGGSGLYLNAIMSPLGFAAPSDMATREKLSKEYDVDPQKSYETLFACDRETATRLHPHDKKRIVRALEVYTCSGQPLSAYGNDFFAAAQTDAHYDAALLGLMMEREVLYARIEQRVDKMLHDGLMEEARGIYGAGYDRSLPAMQSIGYKQLFCYFDGDCMEADAIEQIKRDTRRFAKRQLTWFRRDKRIHWIDVTRYDAEKKQEILITAKELIDL